jgi:predicted Zn-dependent protease with MMP-like domain
MPINYYSIHRNKSKRKVIRLGKYLSPEQKRNLALRMFAAMPDGLKKNSQDMVIFTKGFREDNLMEVIKKR